MFFPFCQTSKAQSSNRILFHDLFQWLFCMPQVPSLHLLFLLKSKEGILHCKIDEWVGSGRPKLKEMNEDWS